jgi:hypothetical protein
MKRIYTTLVAVFAIIQFSYAQWSGAPGDIHYNTGNVGIGTTSFSALLTVGSSSTRGTINVVGTPTDNPAITISDLQTGGHQYTLYGGVSNAGNLDIYDQTAGAYRFTLSSSGYVGVGTTSPGAKLDIENGTALINTDALAGLGGQVTISNGYGNQNGYVKLNLNNGGAVSWIKGIVTGPNTNTGSAMAFGVPANTTDGSEAMRITSDGNLAVGTTNTLGYKLAVNGSAIAESVTVKLHGSWPDYVFKPAYTLPSLNEIKTYIDQNHHLSEMPSEREVKDNGINLGEMNKLLVKKVEELTLYLIEKDKQVTKEQQVNKEQQNQLKQQEARITVLEKALAKLTDK